MKIKVILILTLLVSCSKDYIEEVIDNSTQFIPKIESSAISTSSPETQVTAQKQVLNLFSSKAPFYTGINNTVGSIRKNYYYPGTNHIPGFDENNYNIIADIDNSLRGTDHKNLTFLDFDNNGYLDLFSIVNSRTDPNDSLFSEGSDGMNWGGTCTNLIRIVKNAFTNESEEFYYASPYNSPAWVQVNDFNGDGIDDVLVGSHNSHICASYQGYVYGEHLPVHIYFINEDGTFTTTDVTPPTSMWDIATGDIDNDGDIDIVYKSSLTSGRPSPSNQEGKPWIYLNDGSGNFTETNPFEYFIGLEEILNSYEAGIHNQAIDLFDLNNDNILDLILADDPFLDYHKDTNELIQGDVGYWHVCCQYVYSARVYWGQGEGKFNMNEYSKIPNNWIMDKNTSGKPTPYLSISFIDHNNDGYYDIVLSGEQKTNLPSVSYELKGYYLQIATNNGDKTFEDSTLNLVNNYWNNNNLPWWKNLIFYEIIVNDLDNDGDYDLIPYSYLPGMGSAPPSGQDVFFFRNDGGFFNKLPFYEP